MEFEIPKERNPGKIAEVTIGATSGQGGTRSHTITIGGGTALPFHYFEGDQPHRPALAMEVIDVVTRLERRFGTVAVEKGFTTKEQILEAMKQQVEEDLDGKEHRRIGSILYSLGYITIPQINEVLESMQKPGEK